MLDRLVRPLIDPPLAAAARALARAGVRADAVTLLGGAVGVGSAFAVAAGRFGLALLLVALCRILDGVDGALARHTRPTEFGGYLDAICDFVFYAALPLGFAFADPSRNALPAAVLLASFLGTAASFLAFAAIAARRGLASAAQGPKAFYYLGGLAEGTETIAVFVAMCIWPQAFPGLALGFAALCAVTVVGRVATAWRLLR
jgi:phosphatidylglycerophosphate synthase